MHVVHTKACLADPAEAALVRTVWHTVSHIICSQSELGIIAHLHIGVGGDGNFFPFEAPLQQQGHSLKHLQDAHIMVPDTGTSYVRSLQAAVTSTQRMQ